MKNDLYLKMLYVVDSFYEKNKIHILWSNGLLVKCSSITSLYGTDTEPEDEDYIG